MLKKFSKLFNFLFVDFLALNVYFSAFCFLLLTLLLVSRRMSLLILCLKIFWFSLLILFIRPRIACFACGFACGRHENVQKKLQKTCAGGLLLVLQKPAGACCTQPFQKEFDLYHDFVVENLPISHLMGLVCHQYGFIVASTSQKKNLK